MELHLNQLNMYIGSENHYTLKIHQINYIYTRHNIPLTIVSQFFVSFVINTIPLHLVVIVHVKIGNFMNNAS
jgi:hypothetical protein